MPYFLDDQDEYYVFRTGNEHVIGCDEDRKRRVDTNEPKTFNSFALLRNYDNGGGENYQHNNYRPGGLRIEKGKGSSDGISNTTLIQNQQSVVGENK